MIETIRSWRVWAIIAGIAAAAWALVYFVIFAKRHGPSEVDLREELAEKAVESAEATIDAIVTAEKETREKERKEAHEQMDSPLSDILNMSRGNKRASGAKD